MSNAMSRERDAVEREADLAEERFLLATQVEIQRLLNEKGLRYKDLAHRLSVSEARVSQLFSDDASNLTIRTIAKIFYKLGETPRLMTERALNKRLAEASGEASPSGGWIVTGSLAAFDVGLGSEFVPAQEEETTDRTRRPSGLDWAQAEGAFQARSAYAA